MASFVYWNKLTGEWEKTDIPSRCAYAKNTADGQLWVKTEGANKWEGKWAKTDNHPLPNLVQGYLFNE